MDLRLAGRRAVVTGGSRGIGLATARALAAEGMDVALVARDQEALDDAAEELAAASGRRVVGVAADTGDGAAVTAMAREAVRRLGGGVDVLVNAAANVNAGGFPEEELAHEVNVKVAGYLRTARALAPGMVERGWGRIVNVSGMAARQTGSVVGSVRNAAVVALGKNLADELGPHGVGVVTVHPGLTRTERVDALIEGRSRAMGVDRAEGERRMSAGVSLGRLVTADEVAAVIAFVASPLAVALGGGVITADGGSPGSIHY